MQLKKYVPLVVLCAFSLAFVSWTINNENIEVKVSIPTPVKVKSEIKLAVPKVSVADKAMEMIYDSLQLDTKGLSQEAFEYAMEGFEKLVDEGVLKNDSVLTVIDFDQPSYKKRMYILDVKNYKVLFNTLVAHGMNTGKEMAESFSNTDQSHKSSLGFYITDNTYYGSKGFSLKLRGIDGKLNSNAMRRAIVIHGAPYVSQSLIDAQGYIGRSHGCPAVPMSLAKPIIQTIKDGSCLFIYNSKYQASENFRLG